MTQSGGWSEVGSVMVILLRPRFHCVQESGKLGSTTASDNVLFFTLRFHFRLLQKQLPVLKIEKADARCAHGHIATEMMHKQVDEE